MLRLHSSARPYLTCTLASVLAPCRSPAIWGRSLLAHTIRRCTCLSPRRERECQRPKSASILARTSLKRNRSLARLRTRKRSEPRQRAGKKPGRTSSRSVLNARGLAARAGRNTDSFRRSRWRRGPRDPARPKIATGGQIVDASLNAAEPLFSAQRPLKIIAQLSEGDRPKSVAAQLGSLLMISPSGLSQRLLHFLRQIGSR